MLIFKLNKSNDPDITYIYSMREAEARSLGTYDSIVNTDFTLLCDSGIKYSVSVIKDVSGKFRYISDGEIEMTEDNMWVVESITKFGRIMSPKEITRFYSERLSRL